MLLRLLSRPTRSVLQNEQLKAEVAELKMYGPGVAASAAASAAAQKEAEEASRPSTPLAGSSRSLTPTRRGRGGAEPEGELLSQLAALQSRVDKLQQQVWGRDGGQEWYLAACLLAWSHSESSHRLSDFIQPPDQHSIELFCRALCNLLPHARLRTHPPFPRPAAQHTAVLDCLEDYSPYDVSLEDAAAGADPDQMEEAEERLLASGFDSSDAATALDVVLKAVAICSSFGRGGGRGAAAKPAAAPAAAADKAMQAR